MSGRKPIQHPGIWAGYELESRQEWKVCLGQEEIGELIAAADQSSHLPIGQIRKENFPLPTLGKSLDKIQDNLENSIGATLIKGFPAQDLGEDIATRAFWGICSHIGTAVSQSALGERIFSVRNEGYQDGDNRQRGPNTSRKLSFHSDRSDVIAFLCWKQAKSGGENQIVHAMALHNAILHRSPGLLEELYQPYYFKRHNVDSAHELPYCRQPIFSVTDGHFACNILRVLIDRAYNLPELPDMTLLQKDALDLVEETAGDPSLHYAFRQDPGDLLFLNNFTVLHRRNAFTDYPQPDRKRHIYRIWLSVPNSRPLDPLFKENYGAVEPGALRGGMKPDAKSAK